MPNQIMRTISIAAGVVGLLTVAACGDTTVQPTFGSACKAGQLRSGEVVTGNLDEHSCVVPYHFWSGYSTRYESYSVQLERGKGYMFTMRRAPDADGLNEIDALLALWGRDAHDNSVPLAVSDDDAGGVQGRDAEFFFIAPKSGTFNLVASSYRNDQTGGYRVSMQECPVVAVADTAGSYDDIPFAPSECVRHELVDDYVSRIVLVAVKVDPFDRVDLNVTSDDFTPAIELGGPGTDVYENIYQETQYGDASGSPSRVVLNMDGIGGTLTLAVGATTFDPTGRFSIGIDREEQALEAAVRAPGDSFTLRPTGAQRKKR